MPTSSLITMDAANMYCGKGANSGSLHLKLIDVKLPSIEEIYIDHRAGGAPVMVEIDVMLGKLACEFTLAGWDARTLQMLRPLTLDNTEFMIFGLIRDYLTGEYNQAKAHIVGRLGHVEHGIYRHETLFRTHYAIRGISFYDLTVANELIYNWDFFSNRFVVGSNQ